MLNGDFSAVASAQCRAQGNLALPAALGFANNRIDPALLSPAAVRISRLLPTTSDPCGRITYSRTLEPHESLPIGKVDWQISQNHSIFARYMMARTFWEPALTNSPDNLLVPGTTGGGGRDNSQHSLAVGDTMVLTNNVVNNIRVSVNRTSVVRTHAPMFGPEDVGVKMFSYIPDYMNITTTGAFSINTGTETFSYYKPNSYGVSDDLTWVRGSHQFGFGGTYQYSNWKTESNVRSMGPMSFNGGVTGLPLADFLLGRVFEYRQSTPFRQDIKQPYFALYGQDTWRVSPNITLNYGARWEPWFPQDSEDGAFYSFDIDRWRTQTRSRVFPQAPPGLNYPGDEGFPGNTGMKTVWTNIAPRVGISWDPKADGRMSIRAGYGMTGDFVTGQFFFDSRSAPPFGLEQRLNGSLLDDPCGVGRQNESAFPDLFRQLPVELRALSAVHHRPIRHQDDAKSQLERRPAAADRRQHGVLRDLPRDPSLQRLGCRRRQSRVGDDARRDRHGSVFGATAERERPDVRQLQQFARSAAGAQSCEPGTRPVLGYLDYVVDAGWQDYQGLLFSVQRRSARGIAASANYTLSRCEGLINQGQGPLNVATGYMKPISLLNPPSEAETQAIYDSDKGQCSAWRKHIFNLTVSIESPQFTNTTVRALASGWRLSGIFRAASGDPLTITTGADRPCRASRRRPSGPTRSPTSRTATGRAISG